MQSIVISILTIFLGLSCAKKPEDKYPENYKRDYFNLDLFKNTVVLKTGKASNFDRKKRKVNFEEGEEALKSIFKGYELKSKEENKTIKVHFDMHHGFGNLDKAIDLLDNDNKNDFREFVNKNGSFNPFNMFICNSYSLLNDICFFLSVRG